MRSNSYLGGFWPVWKSSLELGRTGREADGGRGRQPASKGNDRRRRGQAATATRQSSRFWNSDGKGIAGCSTGISTNMATYCRQQVDWKCPTRLHPHHQTRRVP